jgi:CheY-like chemotaxis protein
LPTVIEHQILVVDDNQDSASTMARLLKVLGFNAKAAYSGEDALNAIKEEIPELVFLDLSMPSMDGVETARRIREIPGGGGIALVALSGMAREEDILRSRQAGFVAHLAKPISLPQLEQTLALHVGFEPTKCQLDIAT